MESILNGFAANSKEAKWKKRSNTIPFSSKKHLGTQNCIFPPFLRFCHLNHSFFTFDAPPQLKEWQKKIRQKESEIQQAEIDYLELQREKGRVSPRAIEQGWSEDLADNIEKGRKLVTDLKLEHILNLSFEARRSEEKLEQRKFRINEAIWWRNELNTWKDCELQDMWDRENARKHAEEHRAKVQAIADEKRRWSVLKTTILFCTFLIVRLLFWCTRFIDTSFLCTLSPLVLSPPRGVLFFTKEGKPDKRRQRGKKWDPSVYAGQERDIFVSSEVVLIWVAFSSTWSTSHIFLFPWLRSIG